MNIYTILSFIIVLALKNSILNYTLLIQILQGIISILI